VPETAKIEISPRGMEEERIYEMRKKAEKGQRLIPHCRREEKNGKGSLFGGIRERTGVRSLNVVEEERRSIHPGGEEDY